MLEQIRAKQIPVEDLIAGLIVAIMLVPQGMAYALLAGLPPQVGLYASITPLVIYGLLGSSRALSVGPTAVVSLFVASGVSQFAASGSENYLALTLILALQIGIIQILLGVIRAGFLVNFLSHSVLSGFTSAAALIIGISQIKHITGLTIPRSDRIDHTLGYTLENLRQLDVTTVLLSIGSMLVLLFFKYRVSTLLNKWPLSPILQTSLSKIGPLVVVAAGTLLAALMKLNIAQVGDVPDGLPPLTTPRFDTGLWLQMLPTAITISIIGYMESISVAKSLASRRREKIRANQELLALGAANIGAAFTGAYPVTGGFSRSVVNFEAGARSGLASIVTAVLVAMTLLLFTPLFIHLPNAVLATIIIIAVTGLFDIKTLRHTWHYSKIDAISLLSTFFAVLGFGIEIGLVIGVATSLLLYVWRTSRPHIAVVGRIGNSEHFRNVKRHPVKTYTNVLAIRVDESLYFPNVQYLETFIQEQVADCETLHFVVLVCSAINYIDTSALEMLERLRHDLSQSGVDLYLAEVKGPVFDRLAKIGFVDQIGQDHIFLSLHQAMETLALESDAQQLVAHEAGISISSD